MSYTVVTDSLPEYPNTLISFFLRGGSFEIGESHPPQQVDVTTDGDGEYEVELYANAGGLTESEWVAMYPGPEIIKFVLPESLTPVLMSTLREQSEGWPLDAELTPETVDVERARYANTASPDLGDFLIGTKATGTGGVATTVHDKLEQIRLTTDRDTFANAVTNAANKTLTINSTMAVPSSMTVSGVALKFEQHGQLVVASGQTLTLNCPIEAGRHQVFAGAGSVAGSPIIEFACPEWFGAAGNGTTDDTVAWQKAVTFFGVVRGRPGASYLINGQRLQWTANDLHRIGRFDPEPAAYSEGYWYGVSLPSGTIVEDAAFVVTHSGVVTRGPHAFASGDPLSVTRHRKTTMRRCSFTIAADCPAAPTRARVFLTQSSDDFTFERNTLSTEDFVLVRLIGGYLFDSHRSNVSHNTCIGIHLLGVWEFCDVIKFTHNNLNRCSLAFDMDKHDRYITTTHNTFITTGGTTDDAVFEYNAPKHVIHTNNTVDGAFRYVILSGKPDVWDTWAMALAGAGTHQFTVWGDVFLDHNVVRNTVRHAVLVGSAWTVEEADGEDGYVPHDGVAAGKNLFIGPNEIYDLCALDSDSTSNLDSVVRVQEGTNIRSYATITNSPGQGYYLRSYLNVDAAGATTYSDLDVTLGGRVEACAGGAFYIRFPRLVRFDRFVVRSNGAGRTVPKQGTITYPESRSATIRGTLEMDAAGATLTRGLEFLGAEMRTGWYCDLTDPWIIGHTTDLLLSPDDNNLRSAELIHWTGGRIDTTNFQSSTTANIVRQPLTLYGSAVPTGTGSNATYYEVGTIFVIHPPVAGQPSHYKCVTAGKPGVWKVETTLAS